MSWQSFRAALLTGCCAALAGCPDADDTAVDDTAVQKKAQLPDTTVPDKASPKKAEPSGRYPGLLIGTQADDLSSVAVLPTARLRQRVVGLGIGRASL